MDKFPVKIYEDNIYADCAYTYYLDPNEPDTMHYVRYDIASAAIENAIEYRKHIEELQKDRTERDIEIVKATVKEALYQLSRSAKFGGCSDHEIMSWVDPQEVLYRLDNPL